MWAGGHCCSNWFDCVMCLERKAEIDATYPPMSADTESGAGHGRLAGEVSGAVAGRGDVLPADQGAAEAAPERAE
jgi:hypothetical protein